MPRVHSIRIPVHGFVEFDDWERDIINHPVFQRLRRIRQLAFSDHLYPGSTHTRFEHSLGVMHVATRLYDAIKQKYRPILEDRFNCLLDRSNSRTLVRLAALLHDVGHAPFSHVSEDLMPTRKDGRRMRHEDYSAALIREEMRDVIDEHPDNKNQFSISAADVADFLLGSSRLSAVPLFWRELVDGQLDADRMDYLLRDSLHCGVEYGRYDLDRIIDTVTLVQNKSDKLNPDPRIAISEGGRPAAEGLLLARYFMFQQVYFHEVRKAYDHHAAECLKEFLRKKYKSPQLPDPTNKRGRRRFLALDDWVLSKFIMGSVSKSRHARAIIEHKHDREIDRTPEVAEPQEIQRLGLLCKVLQDAGIDSWIGDADKEWYKQGGGEIQISQKTSSELEVPRGDPLSEVSTVVRELKGTKRRVLFVPHNQFDPAMKLKQEHDKG